MKNILLLLLLLSFNSSFAQLNCKTIKLPDGSSEKKCFHKNGKISTREIWDKDGRFGSITAYNSENKELFFHDLRTIGGHAYVQLEYFPNGQLLNVYYSDSPDGGIQYYYSTTRFDEKGNQTGFWETKYPDDLKSILVEEPQKIEPVKKEVTDTVKQEVAECAAVYSTVYQIRNSTVWRLRINIKTLPNNVVSGTEKEVILEPFQVVNFDTVLMADQFISVKIYEPEVLKFGEKSKMNRKVSIFEPGPIDADRTRMYYWFVISKKEAAKFN